MSALDFPLITGATEPAPLVAKTRGDALRGLRITTATSPQEVAAEWKVLEQYAGTPFSSFAWASSWYEAHREDPGVSPVIAVGKSENGTPLFLLPLMRERRGPVNVLVWPGGTHSAYQSGLFSPECRQRVTRDNAQEFWRKVFAALPDADAFAAYGLPEFEVTHQNPLMHLPFFECGCNSYRMALSSNWDTLYTSKASAKMRRNDRRCERRLSEHGALTFRVAETSSERKRLLANLFAQKSAQFKELGIPDCFDEPHMHSFFERILASRDWPGDQSALIMALELDGEPIAVNFGLTHGKRFHGMVLSMALGAVDKFGPGRILVRNTMEYLCQRGYEELDFGVGEASYKEHWCDETIGRRDVLVRFNAKGWAFVTGLKLFLKAKAVIKNSSVLWPVFSRFRRHLGC